MTNLNMLLLCQPKTIHNHPNDKYLKERKTFILENIAQKGPKANKNLSFKTHVQQHKNSYQTIKISDLSTLKAFPNNKFNVTQKLKFVLGRLANIV